ncbi:MAG: EFR1 family ferrodoxin [Spirochaetales bacterium]|nr:EFR1 family ferrodoxin [Spirochaetales bacterium]
MQKVALYYFSGTGNSLFVAKELEKRIPNSVIIPIVSVINKEKIKTEAQVLGIIFPCHALTVPLVVKQFIKKIDIQSTKYIFAIATRYGTAFRGFETIEYLLRKKHKRYLNSRFILNMCNNEAPRSQKGYIVPTKEDINLIEQNTIRKIEKISKIILNGESFSEKDSSVLVKIASNPLSSYFVEKLIVILMNFSEHIGGVNYFYHDNKCNGCGICEKVCLSGKIQLNRNEPVWKKDTLCYMCYACVNICPQMSIQVKNIPGVRSYTVENGRYPHPYASINDIISQKNHEDNI